MSSQRTLKVAIAVGCAVLLAVPVLMLVLSASSRSEFPVTVEAVCLTNVSSTASSLPLWTARDSRGAVSGLTPVSPSHVLFALKNHTSRRLQFRPLLYQFTESLRQGAALPRGPSRVRSHVVDRSHPPELNLSRFHGMYFGPSDCHTYRTLKPGEAAVIPLPRPPFDCVWRPAIAYGLPVTKLQSVLARLKYRVVHRPGPWVISTSSGRPIYDEIMYGAWITNAVLNKPMQPTPR